jgi:hypothetical protein
MRRIGASFGIGLIALGATLALSSASAQAETLIVDWTESSVGISASWEQSSTPTPISYTSDSITIVPISDFTSTGSQTVGPYTEIDWYSTSFGGLFVTPDSVYAVNGPQAYTGPESAPVFSTGSYTGFDNSTVALATVTLSAVPEPSTWAMMLLGFAGLGFAGYRASRKTTALAL